MKRYIKSASSLFANDKVYVRRASGLSEGMYVREKDSDDTFIEITHLGQGKNGSVEIDLADGSGYTCDLNDEFEVVDSLPETSVETKKFHVTYVTKRARTSQDNVGLTVSAKDAKEAKGIVESREDCLSVVDVIEVK